LVAPYFFRGSLILDPLLELPIDVLLELAPVVHRWFSLVIVGNFRDLRIFSGFYRRRFIVGLIIEAYYRKVFIPPGFRDYLVPLNVTRY